MELDKWVGSCKIRSFPWVDGKRIYFNVQYFAPGQSISRDPVWDKSVYITDDDAGRRLVYDFTDTLVGYVSNLQIASGSEVVLTVNTEPGGISQ